MPSPWNMPYRIETERLVLRPYEVADAGALNELIDASRDLLSRYLPWSREPESARQRSEWIVGRRAAYDEGSDYTLGMFARDDGRLVGGSGFHVRVDPPHLEIGFLLGAGEHGKGYATESSAALTLLGLELCGAPEVTIAHAPSNTASAAIPRRLGFVERMAAGAPCTDGDEQVASRVWVATAATVAHGPLATMPRPRAFDARGLDVNWPTR